MNWRPIYFSWPVATKLLEIKKHAITLSNPAKQTTTSSATKGCDMGETLFVVTGPPYGQADGRTLLEAKVEEPVSEKEPQPTDG